VCLQQLMTPSGRLIVFVCSLTLFGVNTGLGDQPGWIEGGAVFSLGTVRREFALAISLAVALALHFLMPERDVVQALGAPVQISIFAILVGLILMCAFQALTHAGELGHRLGKQQGSLLLTLSILSIEISLIVAVMLTGQPDPTMARDTMFAGVMLTMNGVVGAVLLAGGLRHRQQEFNL
jgi:Ca2+:H+ antiporter